MRRFGVALAASIAATIGIAATASAGPVDLTTLYPSYSPDYINFLPVVEPGFNQTATPSGLSIQAAPNLPNDISTHNSTPFTVTGNFSATVDTSVTPGAGGGVFADFYSSGGFAGVGYNSSVFYTNYGFGPSFVASPNQPLPSSNLIIQLARTGDVFTASYSTGGAFNQLLALTGSSVSGPVAFDLTGYGTPNLNASSTTTYSNFDITGGGPANLTGFQGGTPSNPVALPSGPVGSVSGHIGGDAPRTGFYTLDWSGGTFEAGATVHGAASTDSFDFVLCQGQTCDLSSPLNDVQLDQANNWQGWIYDWNLVAGAYTIGLADNGTGPDPIYTLTFATPVGVPEPATWAMLILGVAMIGFAGRRRSEGMAVAA